MPRGWLPVFRWTVFLLACLYLWRQLEHDESTSPLGWVKDGAAWSAGLVSILLLMVVNWGLEAVKWRTLMRAVEQLPLLRAFLATLAGTSLSLITPNRTGEFVGRVLFVRPEVRLEAAALTVLGSIAQVLITFAAGTLALLTAWGVGRPLPFAEGWAIGLIAAVSATFVLAAAVLFLFPGLLRHLLDLLPFLRRHDRHFRTLQEQPRTRLMAVLALSAMRYAVFIGQSVLAFALFAPEVAAIDVVLGMPVVYLLATLVPTLLLTDLGVRGSIAVFVFAPLGGSAAGVFPATSAVWTINVLLPALCGSLVLLVARIRTERSAA